MARSQGKASGTSFGTFLAFPTKPLEWLSSVNAITSFGMTRYSSHVLENGIEVVVRRSSRRTKTMSAYRDGSSIIVLIPNRLNAAEESIQVPILVKRLLAKEEKSRAPQGDAELQRRAAALVVQYFPPAVARSMTKYQVRWVKNQRHRWGSCTHPTAEIRLSDRLQPMPVWVVDYVLLHELAHVIEPNHSPAFWSLLKDYPHTERARGYLEGFAAASQWHDQRED